jgi:hypothetical protein
MSFTFQGYQLTPGMLTERFTEENIFTWGRWDQLEYVQALVDKDTVDAGNTPTSQLRNGLAMGVITATGQFTQWDPYATDGSNYLVGFLIDEIALGWIDGATKERMSAIVVKGNIKADFVLIPGETTRGLDGKTYEFLLREQASGRFLFDDDLGKYNVRRQRELTAAEITADAVTLTAADHNLVLSNRGADATTTVNLPAPRPGLQFHFQMVADQHITVDGPSTGEFFPTANTDQFDEDDKQFVTALAIRTGASTYQYKLMGMSAPPAVV